MAKVSVWRRTVGGVWEGSLLSDQKALLTECFTNSDRKRVTTMIPNDVQHTLAILAQRQQEMNDTMRVTIAIRTNREVDAVDPRKTGHDLFGGY